MKKIERNDPCPCGSGKKYKKCCALTVEPHSSEIQSGTPTARHNSSMRIKGGVRYDDSSQGYIAIVHIWDNDACFGTPKEMRHPDVFPTEEEAMHFYKTMIRPNLHTLKSGTGSPDSRVTVLHTMLEE